MLAETKRGMVEHASQVIVVCDSSKLNNTSLAQFAPAERIDTLVIDRLPDDAQAYQTAGIRLLHWMKMPFPEHPSTGPTLRARQYHTTFTSTSALRA